MLREKTLSDLPIQSLESISQQDLDESTRYVWPPRSFHTISLAQHSPRHDKKQCGSNFGIATWLWSSQSTVTQRRQLVGDY